jgi:hypothetical protein
MRKWQHEHLTAEQMIGQLLQHVEVLYERLRLVERRVGSLAESTARQDRQAEKP